MGDRVEKGVYSSGGAYVTSREDRISIFFVLDTNHTVCCDGWYELRHEHHEKNKKKTKEIAEYLDKLIKDWRQKNNLQNTDTTVTPEDLADSNSPS